LLELAGVPYCCSKKRFQRLVAAVVISVSAAHDGVADRGFTHAFRYGGLQKGLHDVRVKWRN